MGPCPQCGAMVGHRQIEIPSTDEHGIPSKVYVFCPAGVPEVTRADYEAIKEERDLYLKNLTAVQERCTSFLEEKRRLEDELKLLARNVCNQLEAADRMADLAEPYVEEEIWSDLHLAISAYRQAKERR